MTQQKYPEEDKQPTQTKTSSLTTGLLVGFIVTVLGWIAVSYLNGIRERQNKLREIKITYLVEAYRKLANASNQKIDVEYHIKNIETAVADIQLFGSTTQIKKLNIVFNNAVANNNFDYDLVLNDLRNSLRAEIDLEPIEDNVKWIRRIPKSDSTK